MSGKKSSPFFTMANSGCVVNFRNSISCPSPGITTGQVKKCDFFHE
jgi:hypothetical protein